MLDYSYEFCEAPHHKYGGGRHGDANREPNNQTLLLCVPIAVKGNCAGFTNPVIRVVFLQSPSPPPHKTTCCMRVLAW